VELNFEDDIRRVLANIPRGTVLTYGEVAEESGHPGASRAVGNLLAHGDGALPWWRVVTSTGRLVPGNEREHAQRLNAEGVRVINGHVDMGTRRLLRDRDVKRGRQTEN
jgi:alkylated DNA nucleotide flippase Atl1